MAKEKNKKVIQKVHPIEEKPILCNPDVKSYLEALQKRLIVISIEKAAKNLLLSAKTITSVSSNQKLVFLT